MSPDQISDFAGGLVSIIVAIFLLTRLRYFTKQKDILLLGSCGFFLLAVTSFIEIFTAVLSPSTVLILTAAAAILICLAVLLGSKRNPVSRK